MMKRLIVGLCLSLAVGAAHAAYEPKEFDVKHNYITSNSNRGHDGRNFFLNFVQAVQNRVTEIQQNVRANIRAIGIANDIPSPNPGGGAARGHSGGGGGGVCR